MSKPKPAMKPLYLRSKQIKFCDGTLGLIDIAAKTDSGYEWILSLNAREAKKLKEWLPS